MEQAIPSLQHSLKLTALKMVELPASEVGISDIPRGLSPGDSL